MSLSKVARIAKNLPLLAAVVNAYQWPSPQYDALELTLYEGQSPTGQVPAAITVDCESRVSQDGPPVGAEWLRLAYHDVATHNVTDGTGGLDASIYYEFNRPENIGAGNLNTLTDFANSPTTLVSRADIIAMGVVWGVASCGGPPLAYKGGRIDAFEAGRFGVPQPQEDLQTHITEFKLQGFTQTEMISLVACGHTIGGVRNLDFPNIVPSSDGPNSTLVDAFDSTIQEYDFTIVSEYLEGTTQDPLVVVPNTTLQSDLNIFASDGNVTMKSMNSPTTYVQTCTSLLQRMINTVPSDVQLTEEIAFLPFKIRRAEITVNNNQLIFHVDVRIQWPAGITQNVTMFWCDRRGPSANCADGTVNVAAHAPLFFRFPQLSPLATALGINTTRLDFTVPLDTNAGVAKFWFELGDPASGDVVVEDNGGSGFMLQDTLIAPSVVFVAEVGAAPPFQIEWTVIAGVLNGTADTIPQVRVTDLSVPFTSLVAAPAPVIPPPVNTTLALALNTSLPVVSGYTFYTTQIVGFESTMLDFSVESGGQRFEYNFQSVAVGGDVFAGGTEDYTLSVVEKQALPRNI